MQSAKSSRLQTDDMSKNFHSAETQKAIKEAEKTILSACPNITNGSGIYFYIRREGKERYAYIGKASDLMARSVSHLLGYQQHIDLSLKSRGFFSKTNPNGWELNVLHYPKALLNEKERHFINAYQQAGYKLYNIESGGTEGKTMIADRKPPRSYRDGLEQGRKTAIKELKHIIDTHLEIKVRKESKVSEKALEKFWKILESED